MKLRGIEFGSVQGASGVQGFFGEGYKIHRYWRLLFPGQFNFKGMTFVAKTTTLNKREGNMPLGPDGITPLEMKPRCVFVNARSWRKGAALNSVGLSGPGARFLFETGRWQARKDAFFISFMSVEKELKQRLIELERFVLLFKDYLPDLWGRVGLQINFSCPNVGLHTEQLTGEICESLAIASVLNIPLVPKMNLLLPQEAAAEITANLCCDALCISNTLPWGSLPDRINWKDLFGTDESPLKHLGGGGLSGAPLLPLLIEWMDGANGSIYKPIIAGGGVMSAKDVKLLSYTSPKAVSLGTIAMLRPWRVASAIQEARQVIA